MISVIVPIYNLENYIGRCLESLINQTYKDIEIICIDDGSTDNSGAICKEYMDKDERIRYYRITNGGVSNARNYALELIRGKWFAFVDGDDWLEPEFYEILVSNVEKYNCEISACQFQLNYEYTLGYDKSAIKEKVLNSSDECIHSFICNDISLQGQSTNKIYLAEKFKDIKFDTMLKVNEDCMYTYNIMKKCDSACVCENQMYHWYIRKDSACRSKNLDVAFDAANVFIDLLSKTEKMNDEEVRKVLKFNYVSKVLKILYDAKKQQKKEEIKEALKRISAYKKEIWEKLEFKTKIKYYLVKIKYLF